VKAESRATTETVVEQAPPSKNACTPLRPLIIAALAGGAVVAGVIAIFGAPLLLVHRQDLPFEQQYGHFVIGVAARVLAGNAANPVANNPRATSAGRDAYTGSCAESHGSSGDGKGVFGAATYPPATDLASHDVVEKSDAELFWITKNGLSFTAMPGFGDQYSDQDIWNIVAYMRSLQNGPSAAVNVPSPTFAQLQAADPNGDAVARGAAVYFAQAASRVMGPWAMRPPTWHFGERAKRERFVGVGPACQRMERTGSATYNSPTFRRLCGPSLGREAVGVQNASKVEAMEADDATRAQRIRQCPRGGDRHDHLTRVRYRLVRCCARPVIPGSGISSGTECRARVGQVSLTAGLENW
jgi:mono/diheme cytochrome c family protein